MIPQTELKVIGMVPAWITKCKISVLEAYSPWYTRYDSYTVELFELFDAPRGKRALSYSYQNMPQKAFSVVLAANPCSCTIKTIVADLCS